MNKKLINGLLPYVVAIVVFLSITMVYFSPLWEGKVLKQHDITMFKGMSKEIVDFRAENNGKEPLWTNSMFGGMPAWQISVKYAGNLMQYVDKALRLGLPTPADYVFLYFLGFFILMLVMKVDPWLSLVGAIGFALSSYFFIILGAGHTSKAHAIGYMAPVLAGIILTFNGKYLKGALLTAVALSLEIIAGHLQITYYLLMLILIYGVFMLYQSLKEKKMPRFYKATGILLLAASFAILTNITSLWGTYQYSKYTLRGKPILTKEKENKSGGLDKDYITGWSYGIGETWSLLFPDIKGGATGAIGNNNDALKDVPTQYRRVIAGQNAYWGDQPGTSGPVYVGAVIVFFFILAMFVLDDRIKWPLFAATVLVILLSWGKNMMWFTNLFIDYFPGYNKFRAVSMILVVAELTIPIIAVLGLDNILKKPDIILKNLKPLYYALALTIGVGIVFYLFPTTLFKFFSVFEIQYFDQLKHQNNAGQVTVFMNALEQLRISIFRKDLLRSIFFVLIGAGLLYFFLKGKLKKRVLLLLLAVLIVVDMVGVNLRYLNQANYEPERLGKAPFNKTQADNFIDKDVSPDFRVADLTKDIFQDASTSYFHHSIGGYHGAKLLRYQDIINEYLLSEVDAMRKVLSSRPTMIQIDSVLRAQQMLNVLNTKYLIYNPNAEPILNNYAFGNAWLIQQVQLLNNPDSIIDALGKTDLKSVAIVSKEFKNKIKKEKFDLDASASIKLTDYHANRLVYQFKSKVDQLSVFSEIYYPKGWDVFIDGKPADYFRADYFLRAMVIPAGKHQIVFEFKPKVWVIGEKISLVFSLLLLIMIGYFLFAEVKKYFQTS